MKSNFVGNAAIARRLVYLAVLAPAGVALTDL